VSEANGKTKDYRLGVLLVHGIGEQPEGDTLLSFGEPLITWLNTPHAIVQVTPRNGESPQKGMVAESWWSPSVRP
jgi:hypothetical protein